MSSVRNILAVLVVSSGFATLGGCQRSNAYPVETLSPAPIIEDQAMAMRDWELSLAEYAAGYSIAQPTLFPYSPATGAPALESLVAAPLISYGQAALLPINALITPPWGEVLYRGVLTPPTYTAVPTAPNDADWFQGRRRWAVRQTPPARREKSE